MRENFRLWEEISGSFAKVNHLGRVSFEFWVPITWQGKEVPSQKTMDETRKRIHPPSANPAADDTLGPNVSDADSIDRLGMSRRARNALIRCGIRTIGQLKQLAAIPQAVESLYGVGKKSAEEIRRTVEPLLTAADEDGVNQEHTDATPLHDDVGEG